MNGPTKEQPPGVLTTLQTAVGSNNSRGAFVASEPIIPQFHTPRIPTFTYNIDDLAGLALAEAERARRRGDRPAYLDATQAFLCASLREIRQRYNASILDERWAVARRLQRRYHRLERRRRDFLLAQASDYLGKLEGGAR